jgi:formylglycine-generating enzyme required for sulfatase activity
MMNRNRTLVFCIGLACIVHWAVAQETPRDWRFDAAEARRRQTDAAKKLGVPVVQTVDLGGGVTVEFVLVPAGRFSMGSPEGEPDREKNLPGGCAPENLHEVVLTRPIYLGRTEVTQQQYEAVMGSNPSNPKGADPNKPVEKVTWEKSQEFCVKLGEIAGVKGRLPTEAEWEWACRAGSGGRFALGDDAAALDRLAWYSKNSKGVTHPVGKKEANPWGLHDMHGNVMEWVFDTWNRPDPYPEGISTVPTGSTKGGHKIRRGGHFGCPEDRVRSAHRYYGNSSHTDRDMGFRAAFEIRSAKLP